MNKVILALAAALICSLSSKAQYLSKQWDHTYGGSFVETLNSLIQTMDGGFLLGGDTRTDSASGDVSEPTRGGRDMWIVKTDSLGAKQWDKRFGGNINERLYSADQTADSGYILGGYSTSIDSGGDVSQPSNGLMDFWIVRIDRSGNKLWDKRYGGNDLDQLSSVHQTADGGFILGGFTFSDSSGDVSQPTKGGEDFWVVKTDASGNKIWDKRFGGNDNEELYDLQPTPDGGYILGGRTLSDATGDVSQPGNGENDYWLVKINATGVKQWDKRYGGANRDNFLALEQSYDGGYILGGYTRSDSGADVSEASRDTSVSYTVNRGDVWLVKTDASGNKMWDHRYGGHWIEDAFGYIRQTNDSGYIFGCASYSNISGDKTENNFGYEQSWIVKIDSSGSIIWDKTIFADGEDEYAYTLPVGDDCYVVANWSQADSTGYKSENSRGNYDFWIIKFCETSQVPVPIANFSAPAPTSCAGACIDFTNLSYEASIFSWSFPGAIPSSSTASFPSNICYPTAGSYTVTLIASNAFTSDTLVVQNAITVQQLPDFDVFENGDTLYGPQGYPQYEWSFGGAPIPGATDYFYVANQSGLYELLIIDSNGCPHSKPVNFIVGITEYMANNTGLKVYPNPVDDYLNVEGMGNIYGGQLRIVDVTGRVVYSEKIFNGDMKIQTSELQPGIYFLEASYYENKYVGRFVKN